MLFCPKCGSLLVSKAKNGKKAVCKCGFVSKEKIAPLKESMKKEMSKVEVVKDEINTMPTTEVECSKCNNKTAFYWTVQTRAADEGETKFLKCTNCNHTWRDYG